MVMSCFALESSLSFVGVLPLVTLAVRATPKNDLALREINQTFERDEPKVFERCSS